MRKTWIAILWIGVCAVSQAFAEIVDVGVEQWGTNTFRQVMTCNEFDVWGQIRMSVPTAFTYDPVNSWATQTSSVTVTDMAGRTLPNATISWYGQGTLLSGVWITVRNPNTNPGQPAAEYDFKIVLQVQDYGNLRGTTTITKDYAPMPGVSFTSPTSYIDSTNGSITSARQTALGSYPGGPPLGAQFGNRGGVERIRAYIIDHVRWQDVPPPPRVIASQVLSNGYGDCDDFVDVTCAMLRNVGIPCRVMMVGSLGASLGFPSPAGSKTMGRELHALGEIWTGDTMSGWDVFDPQITTNFSPSSYAVLGHAEDFSDVTTVTNAS